MVKKEQQQQQQKIQVAEPATNSRSLSKKKYKGVRMRSWGSWVSEIRAPNQKTRIWLGSYSTAEAAARAYDAALICLKGASANLNFPNSATMSHQPFPGTPIMSPKSIQRIAAAAANTTNVFNDTSTNIPLSPPPPSTSSTISSFSSSSSSTSSPSLSSSPLSDHVIEDDVSLDSNPYLPTMTTTFLDEPISMAAAAAAGPWYNFDSPKYTDMVNGLFFDPMMMMIEDVYEEGDIRLWSFC